MGYLLARYFGGSASQAGDTACVPLTTGNETNYSTGEETRRFNCLATTFHHLRWPGQSTLIFGLI